MSSTWISQFHWSELHQWFCRFDGVLFLFDFNILAFFPSDCDCKMNVKIFFCCCLDDCSIPASLNALKFDPNSFRQLCLLFNDLGLSEYSGIILLLSTSLKPGSVLFFFYLCCFWILIGVSVFQIWIYWCRIWIFLAGLELIKLMWVLLFRIGLAHCSCEIFTSCVPIQIDCYGWKC